MYLTCCKILGIQPGADFETIKAAYRKSAKELHPDVNPSEKAHFYFTVLQNAYEYLLDHPEIPEKLRTISSSATGVRYTSGKTHIPSGNLKQMYHIRRYTLHEVLKNSLTARILYIFFHILFLAIGFYMIYRSVYDIIFMPVDARTNVISAYATIFFAFFFGLLITMIFLLTGYLYIKER